MIREPARRATLNKLVILKNHRYIKVVVVFLFWCYLGALAVFFGLVLPLLGQLFCVGICVVLLVDFTQVLVCYVGVNLGGTNIAVSEHRLHAADISTIH